MGACFGVLYARGWEGGRVCGWQRGGGGGAAVLSTPGIVVAYGRPMLEGGGGVEKGCCIVWVWLKVPGATGGKVYVSGGGRRGRR